MYECPKDAECGFGNETPTSCKHGAWIRSGTAAPSPGPVRFKISREAVAKLLGLRAQPAAPTQSRRMRDEFARETVRQAYATHRADVAAAKKKPLGSPLGPSLVDNDGVLISAADFWARNPY